MKIAGATVNGLKNSVLQKEFNSLFEKGYSQFQIRKIKILLSKFYNYALAQDLALKNPCVGVKVPTLSEARELSPDDTSALLFSQEEMEKIFKSTDGVNTGHYMYTILRIAFATGMRMGEILGLSFENIDLENKFIYVRKSLKRRRLYRADNTWYYDFILGAPKTKSSVRDIPIMENLEIDIEREKARDENAGKTVNAETPLFTTENFKFVGHDSARRAWNRILKRAGLRQEEGDNKRRRLHNARHTCATNLFNNSNNIQLVSKILGHSSTLITEKIYTHLTPQNLTAAMEKTNWLFDKND
jgi:integrase